MKQRSEWSLTLTGFCKLTSRILALFEDALRDPEGLTSSILYLMSTYNLL